MTDGRERPHIDPYADDALARAYREAQRILGYPCPCEGCSRDGGRAKSVEITELAFDLAGVDDYAEAS